MNALEIIYWVFIALTIAATTFTLVTGARARRRLERATAQLNARTQERSALQTWVRYTMFTVTDRDGMIHPFILYDLFLRGQEEHVWADPIAVTLWSAPADVPGGWCEELERIANNQEGERG